MAVKATVRKWEDLFYANSIVSLNFTGNVASIDHLILNFNMRLASNDLGREVRSEVVSHRIG